MLWSVVEYVVITNKLVGLVHNVSVEQNKVSVTSHTVVALAFRYMKL